MTSGKNNQLIWPAIAIVLTAISLVVAYLAQSSHAYTAALVMTGVTTSTAVFTILLAYNRNPMLAPLNGLLETGQIGLLVTDRHGKIQTCNGFIPELFETPSEDIVDTNLKDLISGELWSVLSSNTNALHDGDTLSVEFEQLVGGRTKHLAGLGHEIKGFARRRRYLVQIRDLSHEQATKQALSSATDQMRRILASSSDIVFIIDQKFNISFSNDTAFKMLDTTNVIVSGQPFCKLIQPDDRKPFMQALELLSIQNRNEISLGSIVLLGNKEVRVSARFIKLAASSYAVICQPEQSLTAIEQEHSAYNRFSEVFHGSPDAILILRAEDSVIVDFNDGFTRLLGYVREDAIGESGIKANFWTSNSERDDVINQLRQNQEVIDYETTLRASHGSLVHVEISLRYVEIDDALCILCIGRDITKRISAEAALVETEEKFGKVFTQSPDGIIIIRQSDGIVTDLNDAFLSRSGHARDDFIGHNYMEHLAQNEPKELAAIAKQISSDGIFFITR